MFEFSDQFSKLLDPLLKLRCIRHATPLDSQFCSTRDSIQHLACLIATGGAATVQQSGLQAEHR
jgi:hypothetical protein